MIDKKTPIEGMPLPIDGGVPLESRFYREPRKPEVHEFSDKTKTRVNRNFNESPIVRLHLNDRITASQYGAALHFLEARRVAYSSGSHELKQRVDGGGGMALEERRATARKRLARCAKLMDDRLYKALTLLLVDELEPKEIGSEMGRGWSVKYINKRIGEVLDNLSEAWPKTKNHIAE